MNSINLKSINEKAYKSKKLEKASEKIARKILKKAKENFLSEFDNHPITKEIESGPSSTNSTGTLGGKGNLFSFIGFEAGSNPIASLREILEKNFNIKKKNISTNKIEYNISYPSIEKIKLETPMPWESGRSWVQGIEKGISGLSFYLYKKFQSSRSGSGIQSNTEIRSLSFRPSKYLSKIIQNFKKNIKNQI